MKKVIFSLILTISVNCVAMDNAPDAVQKACKKHGMNQYHESHPCYRLGKIFTCMKAYSSPNRSFNKTLRDCGEVSYLFRDDGSLDKQECENEVSFEVARIIGKSSPALLADATDQTLDRLDVKGK